MCIWLAWIEGHQGLAAWVQAGGAILALFIAIGLAWWQHHNDRGKEARTREDDRKRESGEAAGAKRRMALVLEAELRGLVARAQRVNMVGEYHRLAKELESGLIPTAYPTFDAHQAYTAIFDSAGDRIADLGRDLAPRIVALYVEVKGTLDTLNNHARFQLTESLQRERSIEYRLSVVRGLRQFAVDLEATLSRAIAIADELHAMAVEGE